MMDEKIRPVFDSAEALENEREATTAPERIWLQWDECDNTFNTTWCQDQINDSNIEYTRPDTQTWRIAGLEAEVKRLRERTIPADVVQLVEEWRELARAAHERADRAGTGVLMRDIYRAEARIFNQCADTLLVQRMAESRPATPAEVVELLKKCSVFARDAIASYTTIPNSRCADLDDEIRAALAALEGE